MSRHNRQLNRRHQQSEIRLARRISRQHRRSHDLAVNAENAKHAYRLLAVDEASAFDPVTVASAVVADAMFVIQLDKTGNGAWQRVGKHRSYTARRLTDVAQAVAKENPGARVRIIRPEPNARAVLRFRYVQAKDTGNWYMGSYR